MHQATTFVHTLDKLKLHAKISSQTTKLIYDLSPIPTSNPSPATSNPSLSLFLSEVCFFR